MLPRPLFLLTPRCNPASLSRGSLDIKGSVRPRGEGVPVETWTLDRTLERLPRVRGCDQSTLRMFFFFPRRGCALSVGQMDNVARWEGRDAGWRIAHPPLGDHESTGPELTGTRDERASASPDFRPQINVL